MRKTVLVILMLFVSANAAAQTVNTNKEEYTVGEPILVHYSGMPDYDGYNWIAVSRADADTKGRTYIDWFRLYESEGDHTFKSLPPGDYEIRVYYNWSEAGYSVKIQKPFKVVLPQDVSLTPKDIYDTDEPIVIEYSNMPGNDRDWICIAEASTPTNSDTYIGGYWTNMTGLPTSGTHEFGGLSPGHYEVRAYWDFPKGGYNAIIARHEFRVEEPNWQLDGVFIETDAGLRRVEGQVPIGRTLHVQIRFDREPYFPKYELHYTIRGEPMVIELDKINQSIFRGSISTVRSSVSSESGENTPSDSP